MSDPYTSLRPRTTWADRRKLQRVLKVERMTGADLAAALGVTRGAAYQWLDGTTVISHARATQMHALYGLEVRLQPHREPDPPAPEAVPVDVQ